MDVDYRNTEYCSEFTAIQENKESLKAQILSEHPGHEDMYEYVHSNSSLRKQQFLKIYNRKCSYCGVSQDVIPLDGFEIDHFVYKKASEFHSEAEAGHMSNIVAACKYCNRKKHSFYVDPDIRDWLNPDGERVKTVFFRDGMYYISIAESQKDNKKIKKYYEKMKLGAEIHRIDFLLMEIIGLQNVQGDNVAVKDALGNAFSLLIRKRNYMGELISKK